MYFYKNLIKLISIIILFAFIYAVNAESNIKPKAVNITIIKSDIYINNAKLNTPSTIVELNSVLGSYTRKDFGALVWDDVGVEIFNVNNKTIAGELQIFIKKRTPFEKPKPSLLGDRILVDMRPILDFSGKLNIDGFEVTNKTTLQELNKSRRGLEFTKAPSYNTYRRTYPPILENKSFSCTIYISVTKDSKIYQVSRTCLDWSKYSTNSKTRNKKTKTKIKNTPKDSDGFRALMDSNSRKDHKKKYKLSNTQLIKFEKRLAEYKDKKTFIEKGEITKKQAEQLAMQLLYPRLTPEKIAAQDNARQEIKKNKDKMTEKD